MQNKFAAIAMIMIVMIGMIGIGAATITSVELVEKENFTEGGYSEVEDGFSATIVYNDTGNNFVWHAYGDARLDDEEYSLIYYADYPDRFDMYGGDNPGALIGTIKTGSTGNFSVAGSTNLGFALPHPDDANGNASEYNYTASDGYANANGAKLWMIPSKYYDSTAKKVKAAGWSNQIDFLFETDLITYNNVSAQAGGDVATISIGDAFNDDTVPIMVSNCMNVGSVDVTLSYNASLVTVTGVANGDMDSMVSNVGDGQVRIGTFQMSNPGLGVEFTLADVTFAPVGNGSCDTCNFTITVTTFKDATPAGVSMSYTTDAGQYCSALNGDVNSDGEVDMSDVMYLAKNIVEISGFETICEVASDVNGDGDIDMSDVSRLAGCIVELPDFCPLD